MDLDTETGGDIEVAPSRRDTIEAAFEAAEAPEPSPVEAAPAESVEAPDTEAPAADKAPETAEAKAQRLRDERGRFQRGTKAAAGKLAIAPAAPKKPGTAPTAAAAPAPNAPVVDRPPEAKPEAAVSLKAPTTWKPAAREQWSKLPADVQQEVLRRDRETKQALDETAEARKSWSSFQQVVNPYMGMIQAEGSDPLRAVGNLLQTAATLRTAPPPMKAQVVANLVRTFGIDIGMLDQALSGQAPAQGQAQGPQQFRDPRFDELMSRLQNGERQRRETQAQTHAREVEDFGAKHEFFEDLRPDMADIMEVAARRGVTMTLDEAYSRAAKLNPEVSEVLSQREKAKAATATQATTQRARAAALSVKSRPVGPAGTPAPSGRRGALEAAFDAHNR